MWKVAVSIVAALVAVRLAGAWRWRAETRQAVAGLGRSAGPMAIDEAEWRDLPAPVQRYFRRSLARRGTYIRAVRHRQRGEFWMNGWKPLAASQWHATGEPRFVWDARIRLAPGVAVNVRDGYQNGQGAMVARLWGLWPVMNQSGGAELAAGALQRYLGEAVWFPTALLPSQGVRWTAVDDRAARAVLRQANVTAELEFRFNEEGDVTGTYAPARYREVNGLYVATPWETSCGEWAERDGVRIPIQSEVAWWVEGKREPYWRARIESIEFE